jgi:tetratricopeptide (TPR) repeat protein
MRFDPQSNYVDPSQPADPVLPLDQVVRVSRINKLAVFAALAFACGFGGWAILKISGPSEADASSTAKSALGATDVATLQVAEEAQAIITEAREAFEEQQVEAVVDHDAKKQDYERARQLMAMGRNAEAVPHLQRAIELDPEFAQARYQLAMAYVLMKDREAARCELAALEPLDAKLAGLLRTLVK